MRKIKFNTVIIMWLSLVSMKRTRDYSLEARPNPSAKGRSGAKVKLHTP